MAYLYLDDGTIFEGNAFGYDGDAVGEVVFNTGMTGYQELLTDPSYAGQIVNMTYPLIGNYGVNSSDGESDRPKVRGFIVRDYCREPNNWKSEMTLDEYLRANKIVALEGIDTRALTRKLRSEGTMNGAICRDYPTEEIRREVAAYRIIRPVREVTARAAYDIPGGKKRVAVIDYGLKENILRSLSARGLSLRVFPSSATAKEILGCDPDGIMLTNGPGDPKDNAFEIGELKKLIGTRPIFGICLGHQLLALAHGGDTVKLKYGHRGSNHPVKDLAGGRIYITSQNHGYCVDETTLKSAGVMSHVNWNDRTCEGMEYRGSKTFSVQFHPEANPGPRDTAYIFDKFADLL